MVNAKRIWNDKDNKVLLDSILTNLRHGKKFKDAFQYAAPRLGRTTEACRTKWLKELKSKHTNDVKLAKATYEQSRMQQEDKHPLIEKHGVKNDYDFAGNMSIDFDLLQKVLKERRLFSPETLTSLLNASEQNQQEENEANVSLQNQMLRAFKYVLSKDLDVVKFHNQNGNDYIVVDSATLAYTVKTNGKQVISCDCEDKKIALAAMIKVALDRNLEIL